MIYDVIKMFVGIGFVVFYSANTEYSYTLIIKTIGLVKIGSIV